LTATNPATSIAEFKCTTCSTGYGWSDEEWKCVKCDRITRGCTVCDIQANTCTTCSGGLVPDFEKRACRKDIEIELSAAGTPTTVCTATTNAWDPVLKVNRRKCTACIATYTWNEVFWQCTKTGHPYCIENDMTGSCKTCQ